MRLTLLALIALLVSLAPQALAQEILRAQPKPRAPHERGLESFYPHYPAVDPTGVRRRLNQEHRSAPHKRGSVLDDVEKALKKAPRGRGHHGR